jgi:hypothetical protein
MSDYNANLKDGRAIFIPSWPVSVQYENLTTACKYLGQDNVIEISYKNIPAAMIAVMQAEKPKETTQMIMHFVQQTRMDGDKISANNVDELGMATIMELFVHVIHSQFNDFFESGLAKEASPDT